MSSPYQYINPTMVRLLRSRFHGRISKRIMIVSYQGRRSHKHYDTPVSYYRDGDRVYCFTNGNWRFNFTDQHAAVLRLRGKDHHAQGRLFDGDREAQTDLMSAYFEAVPQDRKFYGVGKDASGKPPREQVQQATHAIEIIEFQLQPEGAQ